jgi:UDP-N-acetylglucosamine--N-acetylmuramyl-(pentapeptide) pyrophosphoryl-undecaprenol N-acetylglucosamine transferase
MLKAKRKMRILISGGGTGGHIYPAIAIANEIKERYPASEFLFVGAKDRMEMEKVPSAGYKIKGLWISGVQRKITLDNLSFPFKLISSLWNAKKIIKSFKPDIVIGTGGFASGPVLYMAADKKIPTLIQEQNSYPGITNKLLSKKANSICVAYDNLERFFPKNKLVKTGNPVRQNLLNVASKRQVGIDFFKLDTTKKTLLVIGGSLGARAINKLIAESVDFLIKEGIQVIWQTGKFYAEEYSVYNKKQGVQTHAFLGEIDLAFAAADFIISRAGASSISELCIVGKPTVFIPSPNVSEDHQTKNAMSLVADDAAIMIRESELDTFQSLFNSLLANEGLQEKLAKNIKELALPKATKTIVDQVEKLIGIHKITKS